MGPGYNRLFLFLYSRIMDNTNKYFKGQQRNENLVYYARKHWIVLLPILLHAIAVLAVLAVLVSLLLLMQSEIIGMRTIMALMIIGITSWFHFIFIRFMNYFLEIVLVTNFRVIRLQKTLYLRNNKNVVDLHEIQDIKKIQQGLIANILNYGKLVVVVPTMIEPMILNSMPDPDRFFRKVNNAKRDYIYHRQQQRLEALKTNKKDTYAVSRAT